MVPAYVQKEVEELLAYQTGRKTKIQKEAMIGGGSINNAAWIETNQGNYFVKWNHARRYPGMFQAEAKGLELLKGAESIKIPDVIGTGEKDDQAFIVQEYVSGSRRVPDFYRQFGQKLASLHKVHHESFGLDHDNYIGSLPQYNTFHTNWVEFFIHQRLEPQVNMARDQGAIRAEHGKEFERLYNKLDGFFPEEPPALLHGDLWGGNHIVDEHGEPCLIDPAVYFGHRESDVAFTHMFGGFDRKFYEGYNQVYPLEDGFEERIDVYNLYPLMVHVNLFGGGYLASVESILKRMNG